MPIARNGERKSGSDNKPVYRTSFVSRSHRVLKMGYDHLDAASLASSEEEDITGELTRAMQEAVEDREAPGWAKNFWPSEEVRVQEDGRRGKRRRRIDIEIVQHQAGPRPRFRFEAKRLHSSASQQEYLGNDGMGCFLDGRYAREDDVAGMLGYIQQGSVDSHAAALQSALEGDPSMYAVVEDELWAAVSIVEGLSTYRSAHRRPKPLTQIVLLHSLLAFC